MKTRFTVIALSLAAVIATTEIACAQSNPGLVYGQVPTAAQWNAYFTAKQDWPVPTFTSSTAGTVPASGGGTTNFLRADGTWSVPPGGGGGGTPCVTTANSIQYNNAGAFGCLGVGTATTVLHGNAAGVATFGAVNLAADVTGLLPIAAINATGTPSSSNFLRGDGQWATPAGSGNVNGPGSAVSGNLASFNGTSGTIIQDSGIAQANVVTLAGSQTLLNKTFTAPVLGTVAAGSILTNATGLPISTGVSGLGAGVATWLATPNSSNLIAAVTDETGTGSLVFAASPVLITPNLGTPSAAVLTNATGLPPATGLSTAVPVTKGGTGCTAAAIGCVTAISGATGTPSASNFLRGDGTWSAAGGGSGITDLTLGNGLCSSTTNPIVAGGATVSWCQTIRANTLTTDTILATDGGKVYTTSNASAQAITLPTVGTSGFGSGFGFNPDAIGAGTATITSASNIDGLGSIALTTGQGASIFSDGSTYHAIVGLPQIANNRFFGNNSGSTNWGMSMTGTQATALLDAFTSGLKGLAPASGGGTTNFLRADGTWAAPPGGGSGCVSSGASILMGNGSGGCVNVTVGSGLSFTGGTLSATGGGGSNTYTVSFSGNVSGTPGATGLGLNVGTAVFTDNNTAGSGTAALFAVHSIASPTLAASNTTVTTTHATTLYIADAPIAGTNETITAKSALTIGAGAISQLDFTNNMVFYRTGSPGQTNTATGYIGWDNSNFFRIRTTRTGTGGQQAILMDGAAGAWFQANGSTIFTYDGTGLQWNSGNIVSNNANGFQITNTVASGTAPAFIPNKANATTGWGAQGINLSGIVSAVEKVRIDGNGMSMQSGVFTLKGFTVSTLPASPAQGSLAFITDANAACTYGGTPAGGGTTVCKVWYNGTAWIEG